MKITVIVFLLLCFGIALMNVSARKMWGSPRKKKDEKTSASAEVDHSHFVKKDKNPTLARKLAQVADEFSTKAEYLFKSASSAFNDEIEKGKIDKDELSKIFDSFGLGGMENVEEILNSGFSEPDKMNAFRSLWTNVTYIEEILSKLSPEIVDLIEYMTSPSDPVLRDRIMGTIDKVDVLEITNAFLVPEVLEMRLEFLKYPEILQQFDIKEEDLRHLGRFRRLVHNTLQRLLDQFKSYLLLGDHFQDM